MLSSIFEFELNNMSKHIIQTINFNIGNHDLPVIDNLNWTLGETDWAEIKGANNSGKTSLLNAFYGHEQGCKGQLFILDYSMIPLARTDLSSLRRKIGFAQQNNNLLKNKTLRANLAMALHAADRILDQQIDEIVYQLADRFSLKDMLKKEIKDFSYSQQILASIARALIHRPKLLLLDQSLDYLDEANRMKVIDILQEYRLTERMTIVSSSAFGWQAEISNVHSYVLESGFLYPQKV